SRTPSRNCTLSPSSKVPSHKVLSRSHTTHLTLRRLAGATASPAISFLSPSSFTSNASGNRCALRNFLAGALRYGDFLYLIAAFNDFHNFRVPVKAFHWIFAAASVCAMYLNRVPSNLRRSGACEVFGNRSLNH